MELLIEKATHQDINKIAKLFDGYRVFYRQKSDLSLALQFITERIDKTDSAIFFAKDMDEVMPVMLAFEVNRARSLRR